MTQLYETTWDIRQADKQDNRQTFLVRQQKDRQQKSHTDKQTDRYKTDSRNY